MSRLKIYRVEPTVTGTGPFYTGRLLADELSGHAKRVATLASEVQQDCPAFQPGRHLCAVARWEQVQLWFGSFREQLLAEGFGLLAFS